jgi:hypothetical protein
MQMSAMNKENDSNVFKKNAQRSQKNDMVERDGSEWTRKDIAGGQKKKRVNGQWGCLDNRKRSVVAARVEESRQDAVGAQRPIKPPGSTCSLT